MIIIQKHQEVCDNFTEMIQMIIYQILNHSYSKLIITGKTPATCNTKNVKIPVLLKYLGNFWRTLEMPLINCEIDLILTWSTDCVISSAAGKTKFAITDI